MNKVAARHMEGVVREMKMDDGYFLFVSIVSLFPSTSRNGKWWLLHVTVRDGLSRVRLNEFFLPSAESYQRTPLNGETYLVPYPVGCVLKNRIAPKLEWRPI